MQAVFMTTPGNPEVLQLRSAPEPTIQTPTQLRVKLHAAGINPIDTKLRRRGTFYPDQMPAILGCDGAGVVEAVGSQVTQFKPGDEVYFCWGGLGATGTGNYAEYAVVEANCVARKPKSLSFAEAAAAPLVLITAWEALFDRGHLEAGQTALIHAGAGGVGHVAIQLAKLKGASVCTTISTPDKERLVRNLGADCPILYKQTDFVNAVQDWTNGRGVDLAFDTVGGSTFFDSFAAIRTYGDIVTLLQPDTAKGDLKAARDRNLRIGLELMLTPMLHNLPDALVHHAEILTQCATWFDAGQLKIHLSQTYPLAEAVAAHRALETGSMMGKVSLQIAS
jgi:NADPH2:quinone reductase